MLLPISKPTNVVRGALRITAEATGTVEPIRKVEVKSKASGEVLALSVDVGDQVQTGALLARIDPRDVRNSFDQAAADLDVAEARLEISQAQNQRSKELLDGGVITAQEYENARLDLANAQASFIKARTNESLAELRLGDVTITAPLAGTIIQKSVEEGQVIQSASGNVSGGTTLFVMANLLEMQVRTLVDETDMGADPPGNAGHRQGGGLPGPVLPRLRGEDRAPRGGPAERDHVSGHRPARQSRGRAQARHERGRGNPRRRGRRHPAGAQQRYRAASGRGCSRARARLGPG